MTQTQTGNSNHVLAAVQLGWLSIEAFGLLRRYVRYGRPPSVEKVDANRRFNFVERAPNLYEQLLISLQMLRVNAAQLLPDQPPPFPADSAGFVADLKQNKERLDQSWGEFEKWSREAWNSLQCQKPLAGQAFACGGDLADTYWYAQGAGADNLADMLRSYRMSYVAERVGDIGEHLPEGAATVIQRSMDRWSAGERIKEMDAAGQKWVLDRLEAQVKVWCDLLFGLRRPESYLPAADRGRIAWAAFGATGLLVAVVGLAVWLGVLLLSGTGQALLATTSGVPGDVGLSSSALAEKLLDWQTWSALLATLSSVAVVLTGSITRLSGWVIGFHAWVKNRLTMQAIYRRTYREWQA